MATPLQEDVENGIGTGDLLAMRLHATRLLYVGYDTGYHEASFAYLVTRVPGGWIYRRHLADEAGCFVPEPEPKRR